MILLDTSALIGALAGRRPALPSLVSFVRDGSRVGVCAPVLYEWWRGPRTAEELAAQEQIFPSAAAFPFGAREAAVAAEVYRRLKRPRGREIDIAIAACAITRDAALWTLNPGDFKDIPGLELA